MSKMRRITMRGLAQIRRGRKWAKIETSQLNPAKIKHWRELQQKRKAERKEERSRAD